MKIFIAVIFACQQGTCQFMQSEDVFFSEKECEAMLTAGINNAKQYRFLAQGVCLEINTRNQP
jgi:hypothetical protein